MPYRRVGLAIALAVVVAMPLAAQQPTVTVEGKEITISGCVTRSALPAATVPDLLVWSRRDIMLAGAALASDVPAPVGTAGAGGRILYWLEDDEDLSKYVGQRIEIKGDLKGFEKGEMEIDRDGQFTKIELKLAGKKETIRVPNSWLATSSARDTEFDIIARRVDVDKIKVLGGCLL